MVCPAPAAAEMVMIIAATFASLLRERFKEPVGFQNSAIGPELGFYAARSYSLMRPPRTGCAGSASGKRSGAG